MTAAAKSLTRSASSAPRGRLALPMADMRTFATAFGRLGHDVDALLADVGLTRRDLDDPDRRIPARSSGR
jgi:hypothetical protein